MHKTYIIDIFTVLINVEKFHIILYFQITYATAQVLKHLSSPLKHFLEIYLNVLKILPISPHKAKNINMQQLLK